MSENRKIHLILKDPKLLIFSRTVFQIEYNTTTKEYVIINEQKQVEHIPRENVYRYIEV